MHGSMNSKNFFLTSCGGSISHRAVLTLPNENVSCQLGCPMLNDGAFDAMTQFVNVLRLPVTVYARLSGPHDIILTWEILTTHFQGVLQ